VLSDIAVDWQDRNLRKDCFGERERRVLLVVDAVLTEHPIEYVRALFELL
jgi:hypothetical protein